MSAAFQQGSEWCWAASISASFGYCGHPLSQARIVREAFGVEVNMPAIVPQILHALSRRWIDDNGKRFQASCDVYGANAVTAIQDLSNGMPLLIGSLNHAMVLTALTYVPLPTAPVVRDPLRGRRQLTTLEWTPISLLARVRVSDA